MEKIRADVDVSNTNTGTMAERLAAVESNSERLSQSPKGKQLKLKMDKQDATLVEVQTRIEQARQDGLKLKQDWEMTNAGYNAMQLHFNATKEQLGEHHKSLELVKQRDEAASREKEERIRLRAADKEKKAIKRKKKRRKKRKQKIKRRKKQKREKKRQTVLQMITNGEGSKNSALPLMLSLFDNRSSSSEGSSTDSSSSDSDSD